MGLFIIFTVMINILGTYECKADSKGRIMLPAPLKKQISSVISDGFVVKRSVVGDYLGRISSFISSIFILMIFVKSKVK